MPGVSALALLTVVIGSCLTAITGWSAPQYVAAAALALYLSLEASQTRGGARRMLIAAVLMVPVGLILLPEPGRVLARALTEAAALASLFTALGFLREAASDSPLVRQCGDQLVRQPPGRRYLMLALGSHTVSLVLNFGVLGLLGTMVARGNTGDATIAAIRKQRMMSAVLRGFAVMTVWSPLSVSFAVTQSVVHGLPWGQLLPVQTALAALLLLLGWGLDRWSFPAGPVSSDPSPAGQWMPFLRLALLIAGVVAAAVAVASVLGVRLTTGAVLAVPAAALLWLAAQQSHRNPISALVNATIVLSGRLAITLPNLRNELSMIGGSMFVGTIIAALIPPGAIAHGIGVLSLPPLILTIGLAWSVMALAQIGLSQIVSVTLIGSAFADLARLGVNPLVLASGLMGAWALSACSTPVGAAVLTIARLSDVSMRTVARDWNGRYVLLGAGVLAVWMAGLQGLVGD
jgi:hypothetical protein